MAGEIYSMSPASGRFRREDSATVNIADYVEESLGGKGMVVVADTTKTDAAAGTCFRAVKFLADSVVTEIVADTSAPITGTLDGLAFGANFELYGKFTSITLASGSAILYLGAL